MSVGLSSQPFSGFCVDPEPLGVSAASVKVGGVTRPVRNHTFHRCLPYFSLFHDPNALRTEVLLQPWNGWQAYAFPPYALLYAILLKARLVLRGPQCPWFSGASGPGSRRFGGSASGQGSVEPASGAVTTFRSVKACSSYLVSIQRFLAHSFSPGGWFNRRLGLGGLLLVRDINLVGILRVACLRKYGV